MADDSTNYRVRFGAEGVDATVAGIQRVGRQYTLLNEQLAAAPRTSQNFGGVIETGQLDKLTQRINAVSAAYLNAAEVKARADIPVGTTVGGAKGYPNENQRDAALLRARNAIASSTDAALGENQRIEKSLAAGALAATNWGQALTGASLQARNIARKQLQLELAQDRQLEAEQAAVSPTAIKAARLRTQDAQDQLTRAIRRSATESDAAVAQLRAAQARQIATMTNSLAEAAIRGNKAAQPGFPTESVAGLAEKQGLSAEQIQATRYAPDAVGQAQLNLAQAVDAQTAHARERESLEDQASRGLIGSREQAQAALNANTAQKKGIDEQVNLAETELAGALRSATTQAGETGLLNQFKTGFKGASDRPYAEQIGQAVKFSVFYGAAYKGLFELTRTLHEALDQGIAFERGLADMAVATGRPKDSLFALGNQLAQISADAGASPGAGLEIGARSVGLYGAIQSPRSEQDLIATTSASVVSKIAFGGGSKEDVVKIGQDLAAITQAIGVGAPGQVRIADLDAYFSKHFGAKQGDTIQAASEAAVVGTAAGFTIEQIQAMAAIMIARTGQDPTAVGGYLSQIYSRGGRKQVTDISARYGVETTGRSFEQVFTDLAKAYQKAGPSDREVIAGVFGRGGKIENAVTALFQNYGGVNKAAKDAQAGKADGALDNTFNERMKTIGGEIALLSSHFKEFALLLGETGMLDGLGLAVKALDLLVTSVNALLLPFDELPRVLRYAIEAVAAFALANKLTAGAEGGGVVSRLLGGVASTYRYGVDGAEARAAERAALIPAPSPFVRDAGGRFASGAVVTQPRNALGQFVARDAANAEAGVVGGAEVGALSRVGAGVGALGAAAFSAVAPIAAVVGTLYTVGAAFSTLNKQAAGRAAAREILDNPDGPSYNSTPLAYRAQANALDAVATQNRKATNSFINVLTFGHANDGADRLAKQLNETADGLRKVADASAKLDAANTPDKSAFQSFSSEDIKTGLADIATNGGSAITQVNALSTAIFGLGKQAQQARSTIDTGKLGVDISKDIADHIGGAFGDVRYNTDEGFRTTKAQKGFAEDLVQRQLSLKVITERTKKALAERGVTSLGELTPEQVASVSAEVTKLKPEDNRGHDTLTSGSFKNLQGVVTANMVASVTRQQKAFDDALNGSSTLSAADAASTAKDFIDAQTARTALRPTSDYAGRLYDAKQTIAGLNRLKNRAEPGANVDGLQIEIQQAKAGAVQVGIDQLEAERKALVANAKTQAQATSIGKAKVLQEIGKVVHQGGNADQLIAVLSTAGNGAIAIARQAITDALNVAKTALSVESEFVGPIIKTTTAAVAEASIAASAASGANKKEINRLNKLLNSLQYVTPAANPDQIPKDATHDTAAEIRAAQLAAAAAHKGGAIAPAQAALVQAHADLQAAKPNTVAYYNALAAVYKAEDDLSQAFRDYRHIVRELRIDTTNPLAEANLALQTAREKLRSDIARGKAGDVVAQDKLDVKNAQNSAESTAFSQRLQDVQTADELGRISHSAYLQYLQNEHNRLTQIAKRTHQQTDELNQIDKLMKDAASAMQGAFNIGDIKLPTPYEVRRYIKAQVGSTALAQQGATGGTTTIYINGADTGAVKRIIDDTVGKGTRVLTTTTRRT